MQRTEMSTLIHELGTPTWQIKAHSLADAVGQLHSRQESQTAQQRSAHLLPQPRPATRLLHCVPQFPPPSARIQVKLQSAALKGALQLLQAAHPSDRGMKAPARSDGRMLSLGALGTDVETDGRRVGM